MFPLVAASKRQSCVSVSTPEAELVAGSHGLERELIPALDMGDKVLPPGYDAIFHEDNQAMFRVIENGENPHDAISAQNSPILHCHVTWNYNGTGGGRKDQL